MRSSYYFLGITCAVLVLVGAFQGGGLALAVPVTLPLVAFSLWLCGRLDRDGAMSLGHVFALAVSFRWLVATGVHYLIYQTQPGLFAPDEIFYDEASRYFAEYLSGRVPNPFPGTFPGGTIWASSLCYYFFGWVPMMPKLLNGIVGGWTAVVTSLIAARMFSPVVARRAGLIAAIAPSLVLWSSLTTKDTATLLGVEIALLAFMHLRERPRAWLVALFIAGLLFTAANRPYEVLFIGAGVVAGVLFGERKRLARNAVLAIGLAAVVGLVSVRTGATDFVGDDEGALERVATLRTGYALGAGSAINMNFVDISTPSGVALLAPVGLVYFFLAPIPFTGTSLIAVATTPEMLIWYYLLPAVFRGLRLAFSRRRSVVLPPLVYLLASSVGWSLVVTNVGTLYRYRAQVLFLPIIFIAADQIRRSLAARPQVALLDDIAARPGSGSGALGLPNTLRWNLHG